MAADLLQSENGSGAELAKPLHLQYLERALRLDPFLRQAASVFNRPISSDESDDGLEEAPLLSKAGPGNLLSRIKKEPVDEDVGEQAEVGHSRTLTAPPSLNGAFHPAELKVEKGNVYNFSKLKKSRKWLKSILLSNETSDSNTDDDDAEGEFMLSKEELHDMLRLHKCRKLHQSRVHSDRELQQYQYYSTGLLSTHDQFYEQQRHVLGPSRKKKKEEKKMKVTQKPIYLFDVKMEGAGEMGFGVGGKMTLEVIFAFQDDAGVLSSLMWLRVILSPFSPAHIHQSLFHRKGNDEGSCFSFLRFIDVSPSEMSNVMLQGMLARWLALFLSQKASYRLHHARSWRECEVRSQHLNSTDLITWVDSCTSFPNIRSSRSFQDLCFTGYCKTVISHTQHRVHRRKLATSCTRHSQPTEMPAFLYNSIPRVTAVPQDIYCCDRSAEYERRLMREGGHLTSKQCLLYGTPQLALHWRNRLSFFFLDGPGGLLAVQSRHGWSFIRIPDKESLITDSGKLHTLDILLTRLKAQGHRVLIYSQMTRMIDLLEEYMVFRQHTYMRLDGSSKISERRDMVADFQSRTDIFVFLLSTRAGGLGINLTAADTVIFYDNDWNPTVDQQAMDRAHRLGQTKQVTVYRLICKGTIEERILQRAKEKSEIQRMVISGGNFKPDTLKPKEVVSLLLDDEELEKKLRLRQEEKRIQEESNKVKDRKRKREKYAEKKKKEDGENAVKRRKEGWNMLTPSLASADNSNMSSGNMSADGEESFISVDSAMPSPYSEISMSSEQHTGSIAPDESSSDLVIVDDPTSASQSRATNSPVSVAGSTSDHVNGVSQDKSGSSMGLSGRGRGRPKGSGSTSGKGSGKNRGRKSTAGSAAAMAGARAGAAAASAAAYAAYGYNVSKGIAGSGSGQSPLSRPASTTTFAMISTSPLGSPHSLSNCVPGTPQTPTDTSTPSPSPSKKANRGLVQPPSVGGR
uniref:chromatin-remodeling ATPase INO80 n=1 Tax=Pristiophorus japonicus TaxID=55135 RepID=UPI00398F2DC2